MAKTPIPGASCLGVLAGLPYLLRDLHWTPIGWSWYTSWCGLFQAEAEGEGGSGCFQSFFSPRFTQTLASTLHTTPTFRGSCSYSWLIAKTCENISWTGPDKISQIWAFHPERVGFPSSPPSPLPAFLLSPSPMGRRL